MTRLLTLCVAVVVLASVAGLPAQTAAEGEKLLEAARRTAVIEGDLKKAVDQYRRIADRFKNQPSIAAAALLQMAQHQETLGLAQAQQTYERIVREFPSSTPGVAEARARLSALEAPLTATTGVRRLTRVRSYPPIVAFRGVASVTSDGRYLYADYLEPEIFDVATGRLGIVGGIDDPKGMSVAESSVSADGNQIAYGLYSASAAELRTIPFNTSASRPGTLVFRSEDFSRIAPIGWSPDGSVVYVLVSHRTPTYAIAAIATNSGRLRTIKSLEWRWPTRVSLSPDGRYLAYDVPLTKDSTNRDIYLVATDGSSERIIVEHPARDAQPVWTPDGAGIVFTSDRDGTPGLWLFDLDENRQLWGKIKSDALIAPVGFSRDWSFYYREDKPSDSTTIQMGTVNTESRAVVVAEGAHGKEVAGLPAYSPDGKRLAYFSPRRARFHSPVRGLLPGPLLLVVRSLDSGNEREIETALVQAERISWFPDGQSVAVVGRMDSDPWILRLHRIDLTTGRDLMKDDIAASGFAVAVSPDAAKIFYTQGDGLANRIMSYDVETRRESEVARGASSGRTSAIAVSPDGQRIVFAFGRKLLIVPALGGPSREIEIGSAPGTSGGVEFYGTAVRSDAGLLGWAGNAESVIVGSAGELWLIPLAGGGATRLGTGGYPAAAVSSDGRQICFVRGTNDLAADVWVDPDLLPGQNHILVADVRPDYSGIRGSVRTLTPLLLTFQGSPTWSPDGTSVAFIRGGDLVVRSVAAGTEKTFGIRDWNYHWFADGRSILHIERDSKTGSHTLSRLDLGRGTSSVIAKVEVDSHQESGPFASHGTYWQLSSDNQSLFLSTNKPGQSDIVVLDLMTGKEKRRVPLPMTKGAGTGPMSLSPNGRTLAIAIKGTLATVGVDGTGYRVVYKSPEDLDFIRHHEWTRDGRSVLVLVAGRRSTQIIRVPAEGGVATFTGLDVSRVGSFDVSPDGRRILFDGLAPSTSSLTTGR